MKLEVKIRKKLPEFTIDVSFCCQAGEMQIITGPSGSGKTTIMRILAGLERSDRGLIRFNGTVWEDTDNRIFLKPQKRELSYVFQEYSLFPHLTVAQNIGFAAKDQHKVDWYMQFMGIRHLAHRFPKQLSGGERQRCALAQALAKEPQALLLDEPFSALDYITREKLRSSLNEIKKPLQIPIIHITHDLLEGLQSADSVLPLEQGKVAYDWLPPALREQLPGKQMQDCSIKSSEGEPDKAAGGIKIVWQRLFGYPGICRT
jgi:molybdate transport system ATP-binding protein